MEIINGYKIIRNYLSKTGELYLTEVLDSNDRCVARKYHERNEVRKTYYLQGKHVLNEEEELDFVYQEDDDITFVFDNGELKISTFNPWDGNLSPGEFQGTYQDRLPFMTQEIFEYFTNPTPLVPNIEI